MLIIDCESTNSALYLAKEMQYFDSISKLRIIVWC